MIYFDNAATTFPKPGSLLQAARDYLGQYGANPGRSGHPMAMATAEQVYETRRLAARLLGMNEPENVIFTQNCTQALNMALKGLLKWGDHVVISDLEHNSVLRPVYQLWKEHGIQYSVAQAAEGDEEATVKAFERCIRPNTRLIACTHGSNVFGVKLPLARLARLAHQAGALLLADCAQTAGVEDIRMEEMGIDLLAAPGHKSLYGPTGTGLLLIRCKEELTPLMEGGTGSASLLYDQPDFLPDRMESGTVNTAGILGLKAGMQEVERLGVPAIRAHEIKLAQYLYDGLRAIPQVGLYTQRPREEWHLPVISFTLGGQHSEDTARLLGERGVAVRGGYHCSPLSHRKMGTLRQGTVRLSLGMYNTRQEADEFLTILKFLQKK